MAAVKEIPTIRLHAAGMSERPNGEIIAQGFLDVDAMLALKVDDYQRENLQTSARGWGKSSLKGAIRSGAGLPAIVLGMRGQKYRNGGGDMILECPTYIIDGLQRITALLRYAEENPEERDTLRIGAEVRFDTSRIIEKDLFEILNTRRIPVSPNVILRNMKDDYKSILTLYGLSKSDTSSVLFGRVQWMQRMARGEMITASILCRTVNTLHAGHGKVAVQGGSRASHLGHVLEKRAVDDYGIRIFRENVGTFFNLVDECWGIKNVAYSKMATHLRGNFLMTLARLLAEHHNFWDAPEGKKLVVSALDKKKLASFPINDPEVSRMASAGNAVMPLLYTLLKDHYGKGKRKNKLRQRGGVKSGGDE